MKKNKKNNDRWQGYMPADCDCKYCVCTTEERKTAM